MATASRAQAGTVRREVLECKEELGRSVVTAVQEPVGAAFRECFEGQLIPTLQAGPSASLSCYYNSLSEFLLYLVSGFVLCK